MSSNSEEEEEQYGHNYYPRYRPISPPRLQPGQRIYLDFNATTPLASEVKAVIEDTLKRSWGNPSSDYDSGRNAKTLIEAARLKVADMISAKAEDIIFTSGGTESNNMVVYTAVEHFKSSVIVKGTTSNCIPHIITTTIEHDSVTLPLKELEKRGQIEVTFVPVSKVSGCVKVSDVIAALKLNTCLVSIMLANNETGVIQPVKGIALAVRHWCNENSKHQCCPLLFHTDAAQAIGKIPVDVQDINVDYLTIVGHKFYGPRIGALYVRSLGRECPLYPMFFGGGQERGYRPGTENTSMIVGLGKAAELVRQNLPEYVKQFKKLKSRLENELKEKFADLIQFNNFGGDAPVLPNTVNLSILGENFKGYKVLSYCKNVVASVGAACHSRKQVSSVLLASGIDKSIAENAIRLSIGRETTNTDISNAVYDIANAIKSIELISDHQPGNQNPKAHV